MAPVDYSRSTGETKAKRDYGSKITALSVAVNENQLGKMEERNEEKESLEMESEKRILVTSQMEEVPESLRYPRSEESVSKDCLTQELKEGSVEENLEVRLGYIGTGLHNKLEVPEAKTLLEVNGQINGKVARILLDTGCSTYVLSIQFATRHNIEKTPMKLRSVDLAVSGVGAQLTYKTGLTKISVRIQAFRGKFMHCAFRDYYIVCAL